MPVAAEKVPAVAEKVRMQDYYKKRGSISMRTMKSVWRNISAITGI